MPDPKPAFVVYDTESNGVFDYKRPADGEDQPRLASAAFIECDAVGARIRTSQFYVRPDGWSMYDLDQRSIDKGKPTASEVNGLTDGLLREKGLPVGDVLDAWEEFVADGLAVAAFNAQHDGKMMRAELRRAGRPDLFEQTRTTCLMRALMAYKGQGCLKKGQFNTLESACEFFGIDNPEAHDALSDAEAARQIMVRLIRDGNLIEPKVHRAKGKTT